MVPTPSGRRFAVGFSKLANKMRNIFPTDMLGNAIKAIVGVQQSCRRFGDATGVNPRTNGVSCGFFYGLRDMGRGAMHRACNIFERNRVETMALDVLKCTGHQTIETLHMLPRWHRTRNFCENQSQPTCNESRALRRRTCALRLQFSKTSG